jgi:hypothetical protein
MPSQGDVTAALNQMMAAQNAAEAAQAPATSQPTPPVAAPVAPQAVAPAVPPQPPVPQAQPAQSPSLQPPPAEAAPTPEQQQQVAANAINDQALYQVPQSDGTTATMSGKELRESILRQRDYTQKTQALAKQRQEVEAVMPTLQQLQQQVAAYERDLANPAVVANWLRQQPFAAQILQQLQGQPAVPATPPAPVDPNEVASQGYVQQTAQSVQQQIADLQANFAQQVQAIQQQAIAAAQQAEENARQRAINEIQTQQHKQTIDAALPGIFDAHPVLKSVPYATEMLKFEVLNNYRPRTPQEAIECFRIEANKLEAGIVAGFQAQQKHQLITQQPLAPLATAGPGPTLTAQPPARREFITADGQGDWKALSANVLQMMQAANAQQG